MIENVTEKSDEKPADDETNEEKPAGETSGEEKKSEESRGGDKKDGEEKPTENFTETKPEEDAAESKFNITLICWCKVIGSGDKGIVVGTRGFLVCEIGLLDGARGIIVGESGLLDGTRGLLDSALELLVGARNRSWHRGIDSLCVRIDVETPFS